MIFTITLNPALDKTIEIPFLKINSVNRITSIRTDPGGKGINVSRVIHNLGSRSGAAGILGGETGRSILNSLKGMVTDTCFRFVEGETRTNLKIIDPACRTNTDLNEPGAAVPEDVLNGLLTELLTKLTAEDIVVISGSVPKGAPQDTYRTWVSACKTTGAKVILDAEGELLAAGIQAAPYLIKPNHHELSGLLGQPLSTPEYIKTAALKVMKEYGIAKIVVSMGSRGAVYLSENTAVYAEAPEVLVRSTVGAGDSMVAALAVAEESGLSPEKTICLSMAAGAASVTCSGTQAAGYDLIEKLIPRVVFRKI